MKNIFVILIAILILSSCEVNRGLSPTGKILQGEHILRKFKVVHETGTRWSGSYFLIGGSASGGSYSSTKISFSWKMNTGEYAISEMPLNEIRVHLDSTITTPYIKFHWKPGNNENLQQILSWKVNYMVVYCREEDFPMDVRITDL